MNPISDYHMHTPLCGHATGEPREYCLKAIELGLQEIGFSDHAPFVHMVDPKVTMSMEQLPKYHTMIERVRDEFLDQLVVKVAIEADFIPGFEDKTRAILEGYPYDYIIGSVHFIKDWGFDDPAQRDKWDQSDVNQVYRDYFDLLRQSALSGMFDIMGHVDLVKKFGHRATEDMTNEIKDTADIFRQTGVAVEINSSGLRKPVEEMYPQLDHLKIYCDAGVPLTFGSDAHEPNHVGCDFDKAIQLAKAAGYKEYLIFKQREIEKSVLL